MRIAIKFGMSIEEFYDCSNRELDNYLLAKSEAKRDEIEQAWDFTRHIMYAAIQPHNEKQIKPRDLIKLDRDGNRLELSPYENQELKKWNAKMDEGMTLVPLFPNKK